MLRRAHEAFQEMLHSQASSYLTEVRQVTLWERETERGFSIVVQQKPFEGCHDLPGRLSSKCEESSHKSFETERKRQMLKSVMLGCRSWH